jgi:hypothetical protein
MRQKAKGKKGKENFSHGFKAHAKKKKVWEKR